MIKTRFKNQKTCAYCCKSFIAIKQKSFKTLRTTTYHVNPIQKLGDTGIVQVRLIRQRFC